MTQKNSQDETTSSPFGLPNLDIESLFKQMQIPGIDMESLLDAERQNIEAVRQANETLVKGWQAVAEQQRGILESTIERWRQTMDQGTPATPSEAMQRQSELAREAFDEALGNMREFAEIAAKSQSEAFDIIRSRVEQRLSELLPGPKSD
jgi:phasin family protein